MKAMFIMLVLVIGLVSTYGPPQLLEPATGCPLANMAQLIGHVNPCCLISAGTLTTWVTRKELSLGAGGKVMHS